MTTPIQIDFVSDVSCTWCAIALNAIEKALDNIGPEVVAEVHFQPFELNPQMPPEGQNLVEHMRGKYGLDAARSHRHFALTRQRGAEVGFDFNLGDESRIYNTFDAHRLLHWAAIERRQKALKQALFHAHFTFGKNPGDWTLLVELAGSVGLDPEEARRILESDDYAEDVRAEERGWLSKGVNSVPTIVLDNRYVLTGAQPVATFEQAIRRVLAEAPAP